MFFTFLFLQKLEPKYSFVLPYCNLLRCPVGAVAILLHFMFDQGKLASRIPTWNWEDAATWCKVHSGLVMAFYVVIFIVISGSCSFQMKCLSNEYGRSFGEDVQQFPLAYLNYLEEENPSCSPESPDRFRGNGVSKIHLNSKKKNIICLNRVPTDQVDASGHWQGNTRREIYGSKIPKAVCTFIICEIYTE